MQFLHMDSVCAIAEEAGVTGAGCHTCRCALVPLPTLLSYSNDFFSTVKL